MTDTTAVIRPSAVLTEKLAAKIMRELTDRDVANGGVWSATPGLWQRYDRAWDGPGGTHGTAQLVGTIAAIYGSPSKYDITIYRVTLTDHGAKKGWSVDSLCDDALQHVGLTLATCPRVELTSTKPDPFHKS
jgi:hypothetical protein